MHPRGAGGYARWAVEGCGGGGGGECSVPRRGGVVAAEGASGLQAAGHASAVWMLHAKVSMQEGGQVSAVGTSARNIFPVRALGHVFV